MNKFPNFHPNLNQVEGPWEAQIERQNLKEEVWIKFKTNEMLFHYLDNLKVY